MWLGLASRERKKVRNPSWIPRRGKEAEKPISETRWGHPHIRIMRSPSGGGPLFCALLAAQHLFLPLCFELSARSVTPVTLLGLSEKACRMRVRRQSLIQALKFHCPSSSIQILQHHKISDLKIWKYFICAIPQFCCGLLDYFNHSSFYIHTFLKPGMAMENWNNIVKMHLDDQNLI